MIEVSQFIAPEDVLDVKRRVLFAMLERAWIWPKDPPRDEWRELDPRIDLVSVVARSVQHDLSRYTPAEYREVLRQDTLLVDGGPTPGVRTRTLQVDGAQGSLPARLYAPADTLDDALPLLVHFHEGGHTVGDLDTNRVLCARLAEVGRCAVLDVAYRLAPEHPFPAAPEDAYAAYSWARANATELGCDPDRVGVGGPSAGGNLAAAVCQMARARDADQPSLQLLIYPLLDARADHHSGHVHAEAFPFTRAQRDYFEQCYLADDLYGEDLRFAPGATENLDGLAPAVVITSGFDIARDEGAAYAVRLVAHGVPVTARCYDSLTHSFTIMTGAVPAAARAIDEVAADVRRAFDRSNDAG